MAWSVVLGCECPACQQHPEHPEWAWHQQMRLLLSRLDEQQRRWYVALEANRLGDGGVSTLAAITGLDEKTIRRGQEELALGLRERPRAIGYGSPVRAVPRKSSLAISRIRVRPGAVLLSPSIPTRLPQDALGRAVPYGIYEPLRQQGTVYVGGSGDTPQFAVDVLARWKEAGQTAYPEAKHLLILADAGGSNSYRSRIFKRAIQAQLCDRLGLAVTLCHYPPGCSKWNPIEHRLFSHISLQWAGYPLRSWQVMLKYIRGTTTASGLQVQSALQLGEYPTGQRVSDAEMQSLSLEHHVVCPAWNYTLRPRREHFPEAGRASTVREVIH